MKHLKKFNELKSSTYKSAGEKLTKLGHVRRGSLLSDWAIKTQNQETINRIKETINKYKSEYVFKASILEDRFDRNTNTLTFSNINNNVMQGNFYLAFFCDTDMITDRIYEYNKGSDNVYIYFTLGLVPADDETTEWFIDKEKGVGKFDFYWDGCYTPNRPYCEVTNDSRNFDPQPINNENWEPDKFLFEGRAEAMKFRKMLIDIFEGNINSPNNLVRDIKKCISGTPTPDKIDAILKISNSINTSDFDTSELGYAIIYKYTGWDVNKKDQYMIDCIKRLNSELSEEEINSTLNRIWQTIDAISENQYKEFIDKSIKRIKLNSFYR
jgi:hypothetical protein